MKYDIIGDIHGHYDSLERLLASLGYRKMWGAWRHFERQALFVGDFIDRGPKQYETVDMVRRMVDAGAAQAVMGNHEFNAIAWFLPDPDCPGEYLRKHHSVKYGDKNRKQHQKFLEVVEGTPRHKEVIDWFLTLPLFLDLPELRVIHACWHPQALDYLRPYLTANNQLTPETMILACREPDDEMEKDTPELTVFKAVEIILKGIELPLPDSHTFHDKDGHERNRTRIRWWDNEATDYRRAALLPLEDRKNIPRKPIPSHALIGHDGGKPVFVGHYWLTDTPSPLSDKVVCVDYSVAKGGMLAAYSWDGEATLNERKFRAASPGVVFENGSIEDLESFLSYDIWHKHRDLPAVFSEVFDTLSLLAGNYAIRGELALAIQARHRFTMGIDLVIRDEIPKAWQDAIYQLGFVDNTYDRNGRGQDGDWCVQKNNYYVSVVVKRGLIADSAINNSESFTLFGKSIRVVTPTDLLWLYVDHGGLIDKIGATELLHYGIFDVQGLRGHLSEVQPELIKTFDQWLLVADYHRYSDGAGMDNWRMASRLRLAQKALEPLREDWRAHCASEV